MKNLFELFYQTSGVCTDTRKIEKDCLFICLKGENFNGNTFAHEAIKSGAKFVIVDEPAFQTKESIYLVDDCLRFLQKLANFHRSKFDIPVIGITGSNGKTTSKELIHAVLSEKYSVLATKGNLNNHIGVPLTLLRLKEEHDIAIIEMGANRFKDIEELCAIAEPTHGIITNIGKAHLEGFGDFEGVLKTKKELYQSVSERHGTIVYNHDDEILKNILPENVLLFDYGTNDECEVIGELTSLSPFVNMKWSHSEYHSPTIETKMVGKYNFYNYLAAISFGILYDVPYENINRAIENYSPENNRSQVKKTTLNTLIMDCYNANPSSMRSALESFSLIEKQNKIFIIGDMLELGIESESEHRAIKNQIERLNLKGYTVGPIFKSIDSSSFIHQFQTKQEAIEYFGDHPFSDQLVLLKGSRGIGLESLESFM